MDIFAGEITFEANIVLRKKTTFGLLTYVLLTIFQAFFGTVLCSHFSFAAKKTIFFFPLQSKETKCRLFVFFLTNFFLKSKFSRICYGGGRRKISRPYGNGFNFTSMSEISIFPHPIDLWIIIFRCYKFPLPNDAHSPSLVCHLFASPPSLPEAKWKLRGSVFL